MIARRQVIVRRADGSLWNLTTQAAFLAGMTRRAREQNAIDHPRRPALQGYCRPSDYPPYPAPVG